jgi:hypothetical protein
MASRILTGSLAACVSVLFLGASSASSRAQLHLTVNVAVPVRSLTIAVQNTSGVQGCSPAQQSGAVVISFTANKDCQLAVGTIKITNGASAGHVDVTGSDAIPSDGGKHWTLCGGIGQACTGKRGRPGKDQLQTATLGGSVRKPAQGTILTYNPQCDAAYDLSTGTQGCVASAGQVANEGLNIFVAATSTDPAKTFTNPVSWTAVP